MTLPRAALSDDDLRRERRRLRRPGLAWVGVTLMFALPLVFESAYALSGGDHYLPAVATVERAAGSDTGLRLAWEGEDGHDTYDLDAFAVDELQLEVGDDVAVRYQSGDDGAYLPDIESVDPDTLADPGDPALWLPLLLSALTTGTLVRTSRAGVRRLRAACAPDAVRTPYDAGWLLLGRAGHPVAELTPPHGARAYAVGPAGCLHASDLPRSLEVLGAPRRGDLLLTPTTDGVRSLGRWCRPVPSSLTKAVPLPATARLLPRTYVHAAVQTLARISLLLVASSFGFAVAGGGRLPLPERWPSACCWGSARRTCRGSGCGSTTPGSACRPGRGGACRCRGRTSRAWSRPGGGRRWCGATAHGSCCPPPAGPAGCRRGSGGRSGQAPCWPTSPQSSPPRPEPHCAASVPAARSPGGRRRPAEPRGRRHPAPSPWGRPWRSCWSAPSPARSRPPAWRSPS